MEKFGRPPIYKNRKILPVPMEQNIIDSLKKVSIRENKPMNTIIQELVITYLKSHSEENTQFKITHWEDESEFKAFPTMGEPLGKKLLCMNDDEIQELRDITKKRLEEIKEEAGRRNLSLNDRCSKPLSILKSDFVYLTKSLHMNPNDAVNHIKKIGNLTTFEVNELMRELGFEVENTTKEKKASNPMAT